MSKDATNSLVAVFSVAALCGVFYLSLHVLKGVKLPYWTPLVGLLPSFGYIAVLSYRWIKSIITRRSEA